MTNGKPEIPPGVPPELPPAEVPPGIPPGNPPEIPEPPAETPQAPPQEVPPAPPESLARLIAPINQHGHQTTGIALVRRVVSLRRTACGDRKGKDG